MYRRSCGYILGRVDITIFALLELGMGGLVCCVVGITVDALGCADVETIGVIVVSPVVD